MRASQVPEVCSTSFCIFEDVAGALVDNLSPYVEEAQKIALDFLRDPHLSGELRPCAVLCFGHIVAAVGGSAPYISDMLALLQIVAVSVSDGADVLATTQGESSFVKEKCKDKGKGNHIQRVLDEWMHRAQLSDSLARAYEDVVRGLSRTGSLHLLGDTYRGILLFAATRATSHRVSRKVLCSCVNILALLSTALPVDVENTFAGDNRWLVFKLAPLMKKEVPGSEIPLALGPFFDAVQLKRA